MIICPRCNWLLPEWLFRDSQISSICMSCQSSLDIYSFPAMYRPSEKIDPAQLALGEGDASCYEHPAKKASALCSNCGRFLCAMCEVQLGRDILCPECVHGQRGTPGQNQLETHRTKYDSIALALAVWPMLIFYFTVFTAPLSLGMSIFAWKRPTSIVRNSRWRLYAAAGISSLQIAGIITAIVLLIQRAGH